MKRPAGQPLCQTGETRERCAHAPVESRLRRPHHRETSWSGTRNRRSHCLDDRPWNRPRARRRRVVDYEARQTGLPGRTQARSAYNLHERREHPSTDSGGRADNAVQSRTTKEPLMSSYTITTTLDQPYDAAVDAVRGALAEQGFGVLTEIDLAAALMEKLGVDVARRSSSAPAALRLPTRRSRLNRRSLPSCHCRGSRPG